MFFYVFFNVFFCSFGYFFFPFFKLKVRDDSILKDFYYLWVLYKIIKWFYKLDELVSILFSLDGLSSSELDAEIALFDFLDFGLPVGLGLGLCSPNDFSFIFLQTGIHS